MIHGQSIPKSIRRIAVGEYNVSRSECRSCSGFSHRLRLTLDYTQGCTLGHPMPNVVKLMRIGQMSKQTGVSVDAIRFYERNKLLSPPARSDRGFRLYSADDLSSFAFHPQLADAGLLTK